MTNSKLTSCVTIVAVMASVLVACVAMMESDSGESFGSVEARFNEAGDLVRPEGYREWVYVGTPLTPNDMNNGKAPFPEFHNVYIDPVSWQHYSKTGEFPEGTVLVKELVSVGSKAAVSGAGYFMGDFIGLEATVKSKARFPDEPGNWAYFSFGHEYPLADTATAFPSQACNSCHENSAADDFVFTQYYPALRAANTKAAKSSESHSKVHDGKDCAECQDGLLRLEKAEQSAANPLSQSSVTIGSIPTDKEKLFKFLVDGKYKKFPAKESSAHPSTGPHSITGNFGLPVRTFLNKELMESLDAGNSVHPQGAGVVKEMYSKDGELQGFAVSLKTQEDSDGGNGWFWYEVTSLTDSNAIVANGNGVPLCYGCHAASRKDFILTGYPLK